MNRKSSASFKSSLLLQLDDVHKEYTSGSVIVPVLNGINLAIARGEFVAVDGPSGSGKSTLCNLLSLIDQPTTGRVVFDDSDTRKLSDDELSTLRGKSIGIVFQSFNLVPVLSALENVMLPLQILNVSGRVAKDEAFRCLSEVGLERFTTNRPSELSGGQQQRVALARALVTSPALVVADEPTANLDTETALEIIGLMRAINGSSDTTFVFATHDNRLLTSVERIISLRDGAIVGDRHSVGRLEQTG